MLLNLKLNDTAHQMLQAEAVHTCERVQNSMATKGSTKIPSKIFYEEKPNNIDLFSEFGRISYVTKKGNILKNNGQGGQGHSCWV